MTLAGWFVIGVVAVLYARALFSRPQKVRQRTLIAVVATMALVPAYGPQAELVIGLTGLAIVALILALSRDRSAPYTSQVAAPLFAGLFIVYMTISESIGAGTGHIIDEWTLAIAMILLALLAARDFRDDGMTVFKTFAAVLVIETPIAVAEQLTSAVRIWPRGDENFDLITNRVNELIPALAGRSLGTLGHPILLGTFALIAAVACFALFQRTKQIRYGLTGMLAPVLLVLSGTRSAVIAMGVVVLVWGAIAPGRGRLVRVVVSGASFAFMLIFLPSITKLIGFADVEETTSYVHRNEILGSVPRLLARSDAHAMFGSGGSSGGELFGQQILRGVPGYYFFDNQYVRILAFAGIIGLLLLVAAVVVALWKNDLPSRLILVGMLVLMASYDVLTWNFSYMVLALALGAPLGAPDSRTPPLEKTSPAESDDMANAATISSAPVGAYRRVETGGFDASGLWRQPVQ